MKQDRLTLGNISATHHKDNSLVIKTPRTRSRSLITFMNLLNLRAAIRQVLSQAEKHSAEKNASSLSIVSINDCQNKSGCYVSMPQ